MSYKINTVNDIREEFKRKKKEKQYRNGTIEIQNASFRVTEPNILISGNEGYMAAEIKWYQSQSRNVNDLFNIYGHNVKIWDNISDPHGNINSNYGWCIYSKENGEQYERAKEHLICDVHTRQASMIYSNPRMHDQAFEDGKSDFICTNFVQYFINGPLLEASVYMRSNDAVLGFNNDVAWQKYVLQQLAEDIGRAPGPMTWNAASLHVYERHWALI